ncbi:MAG: cyclic nucleotide-binding domain-containing protein [Polynucleobacter sp.]|nr:MAG: cyclic nucleotide-binding domain-containing protein [Polynucleobacter sp.]
MNRISTPESPNKCSTCVLGQFCLPVGLSSDDINKIDTLVTERVRLRKGESLYRQGDELTAVYGIKFGTLKTEYALPDGREQITGFHLPGEMLGLDGIGENHYQSNAVALEDSEACVVRFSDFESLARQIPSLQHQFHKILSRELTQDQRHLLSLGSLRAEERLASFLLNLSDRLAVRGYSPTEYHLRMSREEIGSYLGIQLETVSRLFSRFTESGLIQIKQRHIKLIDMDGLMELAGKSSAIHCQNPHGQVSTIIKTSKS